MSFIKFIFNGLAIGYEFTGYDLWAYANNLMVFGVMGSWPMGLISIWSWVYGFYGILPVGYGLWVMSDLGAGFISFGLRVNGLCVVNGSWAMS